MTDHLCLDCGQPVQGRSDKKFCDHQCRSHYYNHLRKTMANPVAAINKILRRNRIILTQLNPHGKTTIKKAVLLEKGFNILYHTHTYITKKGAAYYFCYDQGYLDLGSGFFLLVVQQTRTQNPSEDPIEKAAIRNV